jgi:hypothetical protein
VVAQTADLEVCPSTLFRRLVLTPQVGVGDSEVTENADVDEVDPFLGVAGDFELINPGGIGPLADVPDQMYVNLLVNLLSVRLPKLMEMVVPPEWGELDVSGLRHLVNKNASA